MNSFITKENTSRLFRSFGLIAIFVALPALFRWQEGTVPGDFFYIWTSSSTIVGVEILFFGLCALALGHDKKKLLRLMSGGMILAALMVFFKHSYTMELDWASYPESMLDNKVWRMAPISLMCFLFMAIGLFVLSKKRATLFTNFLGAIIIAFPTAVGCFTLLSKYFRVSHTYGWSNYALMSYPSAIALSIVGLCLLGFLCKRSSEKRIKRIFNLPLLLAFTLFLVSTTVWQYFLDLESDKFDKKTEYELNLLTSLLDSKINEYGLALDRMGSRLERYELKEKALFEFDADSYVRHLDDIITMGVTNKNQSFLWLYPERSRIRKLLKKENFKSHFLTKGQGFTLSPVHAYGHREIFTFFIPINSQRPKSKGLFALVDFNKFLRGVIQTSEYRIEIRDGSKLLFQNDVNGVPGEFWRRQKDIARGSLQFSLILNPTRGMLDRESSSLPLLILIIGALSSAFAGMFLHLALVSQNEKFFRSRAEQKFSAWQKAIVDGANYSIISTDTNGLILSFNSTAEKMLGYKREEVIGKETPALFHDPIEVVAKAEELSQETGESIAPGFDVFVFKASHGSSFDENEWTYISKEGTRIPVSLSVTALRDENNVITGYLGVGTDLTEKKRAYAELQQTTKKLQALIDSSPVGILSMDDQLNITSWNAACEKIFGWSEEETLGKYPPFVSQDQMPTSLEAVAKIKNEIKPIQVRTERTRKDGSLVIVESTASQIQDEEGNFEGVLAIIVDVTDKISLEKDLREKNDDLKDAIDHALKSQKAALQASRAKSEFLANMSHEIRTPLNGIIGMTSLLLDSSLSDEQIDYAESIKYSGDSLLSIINDILDFSKVEAGKLSIEKSEFDLDELLSETIKTFQFLGRKKDVNFELKFVEKLERHLIGDDGRIRQVISNLLGNALKFTPEGKVVFQVLPLEKTSDEISLRFEVIDEGIGIARDAQERLFQPFEQAESGTSRKFGGTGLGLSICKRLVELMGGKLGLESELGKGATFWFELKFLFGEALSASPHKGMTLEDLGKKFGNKRILVAEDNLINQKVILKQLEKMSLKADAVANGLEVIEALERTNYDLILMDCQMPELDGYETTRRIRKHTDSSFNGIPVIALTANAVRGDKEKCLAVGMNDYLTKPINNNLLGQMLGRFLLDSDVTVEEKDSESQIARIDWEVIAELESLDPDDKEMKFIRDLFSTFCEETPRMINEIEKNLELGHFAEIKKIAHSLKSSSGNLGASYFSRICAELETPSLDRDDVSGNFLKLKTEYDVFVESMRTYFSERSSA